MSTLGPYVLGERIGHLALGEAFDARREGRTDGFALILVDTPLAASDRLSGLVTYRHLPSVPGFPPIWPQNAVPPPTNVFQSPH
jgi:hypothetical protein